MTVVTDAAGGTHRTATCTLVFARAQIVAADVQADVAGILRNDARFSRANLVGLAADLSQSVQRGSAARRVLREFGGCDMLINCAGNSMATSTPCGVNGLPRIWESNPAGTFARRGARSRHHTPGGAPASMHEFGRREWTALRAEAVERRRRQTWRDASKPFGQVANAVRESASI